MQDILNRIDELQEQIQTLRPLKPAEVESLKEYYKIGFTYTSNALEGNTLTESETKVLLEDGITVGGKPLKDHYEASGHAEAYDFLYTLLDNALISEEDIKKLHHLFFYRINEQQAGAYRDIKVFISGTTYTPPSSEKVPEIMAQFLEDAPKQQELLHPVEFAAWLHQQIVDIHPFVDGNGRTARLVMNLALMQAGIPLTIIPPIRRNDYIATIVKSQVDKNATPFREFIAEMVIESQKDYLRMMGE